ncbi:hypothetical protein GHT06_008764 [Daphnia sinensis]|uniref:Uncharacterized protein n=1 Tax=Daphnia sinensis TaxID=1820382 RepID=A0AAD5PZ77_9CRUS|nr:hypothetical protein GHT06_008764 [Daphnia sinensis]
METNPLANFEERVMRGMEGRYSVPLPWRQNKRDQLKSNYYQAAARLRRLLKRLHQDPNLLQSYHEQILQYLQSGFISKVDPKTLNPVQELEYYLPHRPVVRQQAVSTKNRPVFDASARGEGCLLLNDCLETDENLNPELLAVLLRFRWNPLAWVGDI